MTNAIDGLEADRAELLKICAEFTDADWATQSGCSGWRVQDVVSHMGALFWLVADRTKLPDIGDLPTERAQDAYVDHRRSMTAQEVLADYESVSSAAIPILGSLIGQTFEVPLGDLGTYQAGTLPTAYSFDHYVHIRMDLFAPRGPLTAGPPASDELRLAPALDWVQAALPQQNQAAISELPGSIEFVLTGPAARTIKVGEAASLGQVTLDAPAFLRSISGRAGWEDTHIDSASGATLTPAVLSRLKVF
ncbi:MAG TPA: maleylpyruvate isomerase family mycothiol-dependent enzyme [Streptosporangiaceae bacterium]